MLIKTFVVGHVQTNCHIVTDENSLDCAVIDPGDNSNRIMDYLEENKLNCRYIFLTHGHYDHTGAAVSIMEQTGAPIYIHRKDVAKNLIERAFKYGAPKQIQYYSEGDSFTVGSLVFRVIETPGHSEGSVCLICGDALFAGDTLFRDSCGRTDFPGSNPQAMLRSLKRLAELEGDYDVYPGHMENTSLERERRFNIYMRQAMES